uniref:D-isomer specific 2-hydroxyacid dehydrogenase catalytic domain-containing protein n=1 Tax=Oryza sativa subsp. japonica TaxID=39947 RepID=Q6Z8P7_ORYSJ|nr:hypothetical protein [Oryza sativa Japonica Group]BAD10053.1 hypothetical protein [Oryza sativa Japonica Group]
MANIHAPNFVCQATIVLGLWAFYSVYCYFVTSPAWADEVSYDYSVAVDVDPPRVVLVFGGGPIRVGAELLDAVPSLRCIITISAGINHIDLRECACRGVQVVNAGGVYSTDVADYAVGPVRRARRGMRADSRDTAHLDRGRA